MSIIKEKLFDESYVTSRTVGLDDIKKMVGNTLPKSWKELPASRKTF